MKTKNQFQVEFGPEVPGYAHLNELVRQGKLKSAAQVAVKLGKSGKRTPNDKQQSKISPS